LVPREKDPNIKYELARISININNESCTYNSDRLV